MNRTCIPLRAHHGMCLAFFEGKGYSEGFTAHMQTVLDAMAANPLVELVTHGDVVCAHCPNLSDGRCNTPELVLEYDRQVLSRCGLTEHDRLPWQEFAERVTRYILSRGCREEICGDCQWTAICKARENTPNF